jgi:hypothetical protein
VAGPLGGLKPMWPTTEVRWFYQLSGSPAVPEFVWQWFRNLPGDLDAQEERVDHYLRLPEPAALGIKLREGRLEVKCRLAQLGQVVLGSQAAGQIEVWGKWVLAEPEQVGASFHQPDLSWRAVIKQRWLRCYQPDHEPSFAIPPPEAELGCDLELAQVHLGDSFWWSLALEAYGRSPVARQTFLLQVATRILGAGRPPGLDPVASMSYPRWLATHHSL